MPSAALRKATRAARIPCSVPWYRTPLPPGEFKALHARSDAKGLLCCLGHLGLLVLTGGGALLAAGRGDVAAALVLLFVHGTVGAFLLNALHELSHGTVFRSKWLTEVFLRLFSFLMLFNYPVFQASHARHHRYTLHPPDDLEVVLPMKVIVRQLLLAGIVDPVAAARAYGKLALNSLGRFGGEWMEACFPDAASRREPTNWARTMLAGHVAIAFAAVCLKLWLVPVVVSLLPFYGRLLQTLCNETQHIGLQDNVDDFRLCTRTFLPNPLLRFLYWQMNYHIEHHMYAAVPCYNLPRLHRLIAHDLPPSPRGLVAVWEEIFRIQKLQEADPSYRHVVALPASAPAS